ncbi:S26 family signal peptidase [Actinoplanes utahensis]|uniref:Mitochondrial inner membrane protease subunit 2 n=1 Tax=Actinoplanes utahensis TaxID=1869 RepID=A0A0A6UNU9_ACTUT|nr:S26 family signal peptidase [Actinoplanes utahensis]KHD76748.1 hypothetical protein MB27_15815 [Actinoplanes utahensis]
MKRYAFYLIGTLAPVLLGVLALRRALLVVEVTGASMEPTHRSGDRLLAVRGGRPGRGDVVLLRHPEAASRPAGASEYLVKRVAAMPGDPVPDTVAPVAGAGVVPPGSCVVLGDSPDSVDSRTWGFVPCSDVAGRVLRSLG